MEMDSGLSGKVRHWTPIDPQRLRAPRGLVMAILTGLLVEFVAGMAVATWPPTFPTSLQPLFGSSAGSYGWLSVHVIVGVLLLVLAIVLVALLGRVGRPGLVVGSVMGLALILLAALCGAAFIDLNGNGIYAVLMALFFLAAWTSYLLLSVRLRRVTWMSLRAAVPGSPQPPSHP